MPRRYRAAGVRGWDWRTRPERLERAEQRRKELGLSRTQYLEYCIDKEMSMGEPVFELKMLGGPDGVGGEWDRPTATVTYPDGTMFTVGDWQGVQPQSVEEIPDFQWYQVDINEPWRDELWRPAILLFGWPRILL